MVVGLNGTPYYWWSFIGKGLRLQPAQQACFPASTFSLHMNTASEIAAATRENLWYR